MLECSRDRYAGREGRFLDDYISRRSTKNQRMQQIVELGLRVWCTDVVFAALLKRARFVFFRVHLRGFRWPDTRAVQCHLIHFTCAYGFQPCVIYDRVRQTSIMSSCLSTFRRPGVGHPAGGLRAAILQRVLSCSLHTHTHPKRIGSRFSVETRV